MEMKQLSMAGCYLLSPRIFKDKRGCFVKTYHKKTFGEAGINFDFDEEFYSVSDKGVIRGMHFQLPPFDHMKIVYCPRGSVFDAFVDLRRGSPTYLQADDIELSSKRGDVLVLAKGVAHGFCSLEDGTIMVYKTTSQYESTSDSGVMWDSCGIKWPSVADPTTLSDRDKSFSRLSDFDSPFFMK